MLGVVHLSHMSGNRLALTSICPRLHAEKGHSQQFICEWTDPVGVLGYLWTPAAISCDGNMTLGVHGGVTGSWTRLLLLLYCIVGV